MDPCDLDAVTLAEMLRSGELSSRELTKACIRVIEQRNGALNAIVTIDADRALATAADLDALHARGQIAGPLHGLPMAHKDLADVAGMRTTYGSPLFADHVPVSNSLVVERMQAAGGVTLGKTNTPEWGAGSHTFNEVFGATRNPWNPALTPGGSSGGAVVALATGMVPIADGSDMGGSLRNPAGWTNVVGLRPSSGRVPTIAPGNAWDALGTDGPLGRTADDVALLLSVMAGHHPASPISLETPGSAFAPPLERDLTGVRVAWSPTLGGLPVESSVRDALAGVPTVFEALGCLVTVDEPSFTGVDETFEVLRAQRFDANLGALYDADPDGFKTSIRWNIEEHRRRTVADLAEATRLRSTISLRFARFFERYDYLLGPVSQVAPFPVEVEYPTEIAATPMGSYIEWMRSCSRVSVTGYPAASVPFAFDTDWLPVGLQVIGRHGDDRGVLELAKELDRVTGLPGRRREGR